MEEPQSSDRHLAQVGGAHDGAEANEWDARRRRLGAPPAGAEATNNEARSAPAGDGYWAKRQALLAEQHSLDFGRDKLRAHEIEFYGRFLADGTQKVRPIENAATRRSANDFVWVSVGPNFEIEVKTSLSAAPAAKSFSRNIRDAVRDARENHDILKRNFMLDLREAPLTEEIRAGLRDHNAIYKTGQIERLFVFASGRVEEIPLAK